MKLKKAYTFLYMPEGYGPTRQFRIPRWLILGSLGAVAVLSLGALLYMVGLGTGDSWLPGGSRLKQENRVLVGHIAGLEGRIDLLRGQFREVLEVQDMVAQAVNLPTVDAAALAAGVGGRAPLDRSGVELPGLAGGVLAGDRFSRLGSDVELLLRQARIQGQGYRAMLDTLSAREGVRSRIPSIRPVDIGWLSSRFGLRKDPFTSQKVFHRGLDFSTPLGTPVRVTAAGTVVAVQQQRGLGRSIKVDHGGGVTTVYGHLDEALVAKGDTVQRGQVIARSGNTGRSTAPHLHYEVRIGGRAVNPISYILDSYASRD